MKKLIRGLFLGSTGIFALGLALAGSIGLLAYNRERQHELEALFFFSQFPAQQTNASAQSLDEFLVSLDLPPVTSQSSFKLQSPDHEALWSTVFDYVHGQAKRVQGPLDPLPAEIQHYLSLNDENLIRVETLLLSAPSPRWGFSLETLTDFEVEQPLFVGVVHLHRLLLLRSFMADKQGNQTGANRALMAAWQLMKAMAERPDSTSQLASTIQANNQLAFLRHLETISPDWQQRITQENYQRMMVESLKFDGWVTYKGLRNTFMFSHHAELSHPLTTPLPESYMRLSAVNMSERLNDYYLTLEHQSPCQFDPDGQEADASWWNHLVLLGIPKSTRQWQRAGETMLATELTTLVLQAKDLAARQGHWPQTLPDLASNACDGTSWHYQVNPDNSLAITFQGPTGWRNEYNSGSSLQFSAPAWDPRPL
jgi:hypothetical protein